MNNVIGNVRIIDKNSFTLYLISVTISLLTMLAAVYLYHTKRNNSNSLIIEDYGIILSLD